MTGTRHGRWPRVARYAALAAAVYLAASLVALTAPALLGGGQGLTVAGGAVILLTLGLLRPWAAVRMARYKWTLTGVTVFGAVGTLMSEIEAEASAVGAEFMDFEGFDFGF